MKAMGYILLGILIAGTFAGCLSTQPDLASSSQLAMRDYQSRSFASTNQNQLVRVSIATLLDLGFVVQDVNAALGSVSARKSLDVHQQLWLSLAIQPKGQGQSLVRVSFVHARAPQLKQKPVKGKPVEIPAVYQSFFTALSRNLFLAGQGGT